MNHIPKAVEIKHLRIFYGFTQREAAHAVHVTSRTWQWWESGDRKMPVGLWELFVIKTGFHPEFQDVKILGSKAPQHIAMRSR
jgi:DNA-binding XRE family transcriptional regulator